MMLCDGWIMKGIMEVKLCCTITQSIPAGRRLCDVARRIIGGAVVVCNCPHTGIRLYLYALQMYSKLQLRQR